MSIYQWLCLLGVPSLIAAFVGYAVNQARQVRAVKLGMQALLRAQMVGDWNKWSEKGWAPIYARQNFENCWKQYHSLGANGVMDDIHRRFLELPTEARP